MSKEEFASSLPAADRGKRRFPIAEMHFFLKLFDELLQKEINHDKFKEHGHRLFQVSH